MDAAGYRFRTKEGRACRRAEMQKAALGPRRMTGRACRSETARTVGAMTPAIGLHEMGRALAAAGARPSSAEKPGAEACAAAFTRLRPKGSLPPGFSKDDVDPQ